MVALTDFAFKFEGAMSSTPRTTSPTYTDLTAYVMAGESLRLQRGRSSEQDSQAQPGRANVALRNTDARFTVGNASSPYAPVQIRRPCRFRVTYAGTTYDRWSGFVDEWGNGRISTTGQARVSASDRLARASRTQMKSALVAEMLSDAPALFYPMQEVAGAAFLADVAGRTTNDVRLKPLSAIFPPSTTSATLGVDTIPGPDGGTACAFTRDSNGFSWFGPSASLTGATQSARTITALVRISPTVPRTSVAYLFANSSDAMQVTLDTNGRLAGSVLGLLTVSTSRDLLDDKWHHVAAVATASAGTVAMSIYLDGALVGTSSTASASTFGTALACLVGGYTFLDGSTSSISHVAVYDTALSAARIADHAAVLNAWSGETTADRFNRLCRVNGYPSAFYAVTGTTAKTMGALPTKDKSLMSVLRDVADVEGGTCYIDRAGVLRLATAGTRYSTSVGLNLNASLPGHISTDTEVRTDDALLINDSTATAAQGSPQRVVDATSVTNYETSDESVTLAADRDVVALNWAQWRIANFKDPQPRCESITVNVVGFANNGGNVAALLAADVGTRIRLTNLPADVSSMATLDLLIEGVADQWDKNAYTITFTTSPIGQNDGVWVLGTSLLGVTTKLGY